MVRFHRSLPSDSNRKCLTLTLNDNEFKLFIQKHKFSCYIVCFIVFVVHDFILCKEKMNTKKLMLSPKYTTHPSKGKKLYETDFLGCGSL